MRQFGLAALLLLCFFCGSCASELCNIKQKNYRVRHFKQHHHHTYYGKKNR